MGQLLFCVTTRVFSSVLMQHCDSCRVVKNEAKNVCVLYVQLRALHACKLLELLEKCQSYSKILFILKFYDIKTVCPHLPICTEDSGLHAGSG